MKFLLLFLFTGSAFSGTAQLPHLASGKLDRYENFHSSFVDPRNVDVWLPEGYSSSKKYAVIYMQDGQMLFDSATTWNKRAWDVDDVVSDLMKTKKIRDCMVVAVWNTPKRRVEYYPAKAFDLLPANWQDTLRKDAEYTGRPLSDAYLQFIVRELKPFIDSAYSTKKDRANTCIAGSSMGGLISMYAICEYPEVFGKAACLSTHWPGTVKRNEPVIAKGFMDYMRVHLPDPAHHALYFDYGTATLDSWYEPYQLEADKIMRGKGFNLRNWMTRKFPGDDHSERSWHGRLAIPLQFLMPR